jgi:hypothetical protein
VLARLSSVFAGLSGVRIAAIAGRCSRRGGIASVAILTIELLDNLVSTLSKTVPGL